MDETTYGTNTTRRTILNNNVVRYSTILDVTKPGTITVSLTLPANNTIDEASVSTSAGCLTGSLSKQTVNGEQSYTNNKATCTLNPTITGGQTTWQVTAYLWGGNNTQIQPTISLSGIEQSQKPDPITVVGKGNYKLATRLELTQGVSSGWDKTVFPYLSIYSPRTNSGMLGVEPLASDGSLVINLDTSGLPAGWKIGGTYKGNGNIYGNGGTSNSMLYSGSVSTARLDDGAQLTITWKDLVTGVRHCPTMNTQGGNLSSSTCYYAGYGFNIYSPTSSLTEQAKGYSIKIPQITAKLRGGGTTIIKPDTTTLYWSMSNRAYGNPFVWGRSGNSDLNVGWHNFWDTSSNPVYVGERVKLAAWIQLNTVPTSTDNVANNLYYCTTWNPSKTRLVSNVYIGGGVVLSSYGAEYGVIGTDMTKQPSPAQSSCGKYGDGSATFFSSRTEAEAYAKAHGLQVNAFRIWIKQIRSGIRSGYLAYYDVTPLVDQSGGGVQLQAAAVTDEWNTDSNGNSSDAPHTSTYIYTTGIVSHSLSAVPSSVNPGREDHISVTPRTYGQDTNVKISMTLPTGVSPKAGSFMIGGTVLTEGESQDYYVTGDASSGYVVHLNMDNIAQHSGVPVTGEPAVTDETTGLPRAVDNNDLGVSRTPIEFDVLVDENAAAPNTVTINSQISGDGTNHASDQFRKASANISVAELPKTFGYNMTASASNIYAGDELRYHYNIQNLSSSDATDIRLVSVLPYNGDSRGTVGLADEQPYRLGDIEVIAPSDAQLLYTTDELARELEKSDPDQLVSDAGIAWKSATKKQTSGNSTTYTIPASDAALVSALRLEVDAVDSNSTATMDVALQGIHGDSGAQLVADITSIGYHLFNDGSDDDYIASHQSRVTTNYLGDLLGLSLDKYQLETSIKPNSAVIGNGNADKPDALTNVLNLTTKTEAGYKVTMQASTADGALVGADTNTTGQINKLSTWAEQPAAGRAGWSVKPNDSSWQAVPGSNQSPLGIYSSTQAGADDRRLVVTYGISTDAQTISDTYRAPITYTVTADL